MRSTPFSLTRVLEIFEIADNDELQSEIVQSRAIGGGDRRHDMRPHACEEVRQRAKDVPVSGDADARAAELELAIHHGVGELLALARQPRRRLLARDIDQGLSKGVAFSKADQLIEPPVGNAGELLQCVGRSRQ